MISEDVDMDAPQITTLRDETTPEPNPARSKFRVKLLVNDKAESSKAGSTSSKHGRAGSDEDEDEEEDEEEDQLIDDDDDDVPKAAPAIPTPVAAPPIASPAKRGGRGRGGRGGRGRGRGGRAGAPVSGPGMTWFESTPVEAVITQEVRPDVLEPSPSAGGSAAGQATARKKPGPPKGSRAVRKKASKPLKTTVSLLKDDADTASEAYAGTAASSPIPLDGSPEPEIPLSSILPMHPHLDDAPLDGVPLPVYPLPSKPFPVQPPPKIGTGFAPVIPLDKSGKPVRKWRQVNREVRGIAGGRWFVKSWVGEKESEFASAVAASQAAAQALMGDSISAGALTLPNLSAVSISGTGRGRGRGARHNVATHASTVASSRAGSAMPESISAQLKKRGSGPSTPIVDLPTPVPVSAPPAP